MAEEDPTKEEEGEAIRVFVRVRPLNKREIAEDCKVRGVGALIGLFI